MNLKAKDVCSKYPGKHVVTSYDLVMLHDVKRQNRVVVATLQFGKSLELAVYIKRATQYSKMLICPTLLSCTPICEGLRSVYKHY